jgi:hypothetical protein
MIRAHKIRLHPTPEEANYFARAAGVARFVWNWLRHEVACVAVETASSRTQPGVLPPVLY